MTDCSSITYELGTREVAHNGILGNYYDLKAKVANPKSPDKVHVFNFFVKVPPSSEFLYNLSKESLCYEREISFYNTIFPNVLNPKSDEKCIPDCYLALGDYALVLEDLSSEGYNPKDKFEFFDFHHCMVVIKNLAWFHAQSIIFEEERQTSIPEFFREEKIVMNMDYTSMQLFVDSLTKDIIPVIDLMEGLDEKVREKYKSEIMSHASILYEKTAPSGKNRNFLCHFDLWTCNILFKYDADGKPDKCSFIDFQWARYGQPVSDILYFLYTTTTSEFRDENSQRFYKMYYDALSGILKEAYIDLSTIFTWKEFSELLNEMKIYESIHAILATSLVALSSKAHEQYRNQELPLSEICWKEVKEVESYRRRMFDLFSEIFTLLT